MWHAEKFCDFSGDLLRPIFAGANVLIYARIFEQPPFPTLRQEKPRLVLTSHCFIRSNPFGLETNDRVWLVVRHYVEDYPVTPRAPRAGAPITGRACVAESPPGLCKQELQDCQPAIDMIRIDRV